MLYESVSRKQKFCKPWQ